MQGKMRLASVILFSLLSLFLLWFGWLYATVKEPLWFHDAAVPQTAKELVRPLYFALMKLIGGASIGLGGLGLHVSLTSVRRGMIPASIALSIAYAIPFVAAAIAAEDLAAVGAPTSWRLMGVLLALTGLALTCRLVGGKVD